MCVWWVWVHLDPERGEADGGETGVRGGCGTCLRRPLNISGAGPAAGARLQSLPRQALALQGPGIMRNTPLLSSCGPRFTLLFLDSEGTQTRMFDIGL